MKGVPWPQGFRNCPDPVVFLFFYKKECKSGIKFLRNVLKLLVAVETVLRENVSLHFCQIRCPWISDYKLAWSFYEYILMSTSIHLLFWFWNLRLGIKIATSKIVNIIFCASRFFFNVTYISFSIWNVKGSFWAYWLICLPVIFIYSSVSHHVVFLHDKTAIRSGFHSFIDMSSVLDLMSYCFGRSLTLSLEVYEFLGILFKNSGSWRLKITLEM